MMYMAAAGFAALVAGCHSSANSAPVAAPSKAQQIQNIQNDPHIPANAKASIIKQIEGQGGSPQPSVSPPPP
jgi:hypothetical protein